MCGQKAAVMFFLFLTACLYGDIKNWQTGEVIPGTEDVNPGPGVYLGGWLISDNLKYADFRNIDLQGANFYRSWLDYATFENSNLLGASFKWTRLIGVDFTGAEIRGANFSDITSNSLTEDLIYSTRSYQEGDLRNIDFSYNGFYKWDFSSQNLSGSNFYDSSLRETNLKGAVLTSCQFERADLAGANFSDATIDRSAFIAGSEGAFTSEQLYSTRSYQNSSLRGIRLSGDLSTFDFSGQDLTGARLVGTVRHITLEDAIIEGTAFVSPRPTDNITKEMIYSTKSYQDKELGAIELVMNNYYPMDLSGIDMSNQRLQGSYFKNCNFQDGSFRNADLADSSFIEGDSRNVDFSGANLEGASLHSDFRGSTFRGANLAYADFSSGRTRYDGSDFSLSDLRLTSESFTPNSTNNLDNAIMRSGTVDDLNLKAADVLTIRKLPDKGLRPIPGVRFRNSMRMDEDSTIQLVLSERGFSSVWIDNGILPELDGILEITVEEDLALDSLIGETYRVFFWNDVPMESRYFSDIVTVSGLSCDFGAFYTDGNITIIPEPGTLSLFLFGLVAISRRKKRSLSTELI